MVTADIRGRPAHLPAGARRHRTASTATCRSRWRPPLPATRPAPTRRPATSGPRSTSPTCYVKIPGTAEGVAGHPGAASPTASRINVTLLFSLTATTRWSRPTCRAASPVEGGTATSSTVASVASFFVSRVDTDVDRRLDADRHPRGPGAQEQEAAIANAQPRLPARFTETLRGPGGRRWPPRGAGCSARCGRRPPPRTRRCPTRSTSTPSSGPTPSTPCPTPPWTPSTTTARLARTVDADLDARQAVVDRARRASGSTSTTSPPRSRTRASPRSRKTLRRAARRSRPRPRSCTAGSFPQMFGELVVVDDVPGEFAERVVEAYHGRPQRRVLPARSPAATPPGGCYERLADDAGNQIDWWAVDVYWGDERCVAARRRGDSNYRLGRGGAAGAGGARSTPTTRCAARRGPTRTSCGWASSAGSTSIHLGLGPDGHTRLAVPGLGGARRRPRSAGRDERGPDRAPTPTPA